MRTLVLALAFAAPLSAVASPNTFTSPTRVRHEYKPEQVMVTFVNRTSQDRELVIGNQVFKLEYFSQKSIFVTPGQTVREYSQTNSKINGQTVMQVEETNDHQSVLLN